MSYDGRDLKVLQLGQEVFLIVPKKLPKKSNKYYQTEKNVKLSKQSQLITHIPAGATEKLPQFFIPHMLRLGT